MAVNLIRLIIVRASLLSCSKILITKFVRIQNNDKTLYHNYD